MRKLLVVLAILVAAGGWAQPKVAVLDAVIPDNMDTSVIVPITDKIAEELVNAKKYSVLDRANVEQVLKEREFQVSGLVQDSDIKEAGKYLGADFVVTSRVSLVDGTYFISAKMINVETGAVEAQVSDQAEGRASVLIAIASRVGKKLATGAVEEIVEPVADTGTGDTEPPPEPGAKKEPKLFIGAEVGLTVFMGTFADATEGWITNWSNSYGGLAYDEGKLGLAATVAYNVLPFLYGSAGLAYASHKVSGDGYSYTVFSQIGLSVGGGLVLRPTPTLQVYGGGKIGFASASLGDFWVVDEQGTAGGSLVWGLEVGARLVLFNFLTLGARVEWTTGTMSEDSDLAFAGYFTGYSTPYGYSTLRLHVGAGIALGG